MCELEIILSRMVENGQVIPDHIFIGPALWSGFMKQCSMIAPQYVQPPYGYMKVVYMFLWGASTIHRVNEPPDFFMMGEEDAYHNYSLEKAVWGDEC